MSPMPSARVRPSFHRVLAGAAVTLVVACGGGGGSDGGDESSSGAAGTDGTTTGTVPGTAGSVSLTAGPGSATVSTTGTIPGDGTCCSARDEAGCSDDPQIAACVCEIDRFCCESTWDAVCGQKVEQFGCGVCEPTSSSTTTPTSTSSDESTGVIPGENVGPCCSPHVETGCEIPTLAECVCASEPSCCSEGWGASCVEAVGLYGCGVCPPDPGTTVTTDSTTDTGDPPDNTESCCVTHASTGCEYPSIAECVCGEYPECCDTAWDETCIDAVGELGCGVCPP